ncbi:MAG: DUF2911 domain-containing protein [Pyrinomonadaceae bacterium]
MKKILLFTGIFTLLFVFNVFGQVNLPRASQRQAISQTVGDTQISIVYHRPNVNEREIWGKLVPYGEVWRTGANEATIFEVSNDVMINGQKLPKGKYSLHTIPEKDQWTIIFNKTWDQWGSFNYKADDDQLRVTVKPMASDFKETMTIGVENVDKTTADVVISWEKMRVPFKVDIGDLPGRILADARRQMVSNPITAARYVLDSGMKDNYSEALGWLNESLAINESFTGLFLKSRLLNEMGKKQEAIATGEKALQVGKSSNPAANTTALENFLKELKGSK